MNTNAEDDETLEHLASGSPVMKKAVAVLRQMSADEKELYEIEQREKAVRDEVSARAYERQQGEKQECQTNRYRKFCQSANQKLVYVSPNKWFKYQLFLLIFEKISEIFLTKSFLKLKKTIVMVW